MEVKAMNLIAWYLAQKLVCSENIEGVKFDVVCASAESSTDITEWMRWNTMFITAVCVIFLITEEEHYSVAVVDKSHTVETWTGNAGHFFSRRRFDYISTSFSNTFAICYF